MRPGPARGTSVDDTFVVTPDMAARVAGREIHPVYGTVALVADIERLCRQLLEPHLEPGEEGVGGRLELVHRAPVPVGEEVTLTASVAAVRTDSLVCEVIARHGGMIVARGSFEQRLVELARFRADVDARRGCAPTA
jgi:fluoroacetyl-CoA thioesterase